MGRNRYAHRTPCATCADARRLRASRLLLLALAASVLALLPAWLGALFGLPLD